MRCVAACTLALLAASLFAADDEARLIVDGRASSRDWRLHVGISEPLNQLEFSNVSVGGSNTGDEKRSFNGQVGFSLDGEWLSSRIHYSRLGFVHGPGVTFAVHSGEDAGDNADLYELSGTYRAGLLMRWDNSDALAALRNLRFELTPQFGLGLARVELSGSDESGTGILFRYGLLFETVADWRPGFTTSAAIGWMGGQAWLDWKNTDGTTAELGGFVLRFGGGLHF